MMRAKSLSEEIRWYLNILVHRAWAILLSTVLVGLLTYIISTNLEPVYQASALVLIEAPNINSIDYSAVMTNERLAKTYAERMTTRPVFEGVINRLGLEMDVSELTQSIKVQPVRDTQLIEVLVESNNPGQAAMIADTLVLEFSEKNLAQQASRYASSKQNLEAQMSQIDEQIKVATENINRLGSDKNNETERNRLESGLGQFRQTYALLLQSYEQIRLAEAQFASNVILEESAAVPEKPLRPQIMKNTILGAIFGLLLSLGLVFVMVALDDSLHSPDQITQHLEMPLLGVIAHHEIKEFQPIAISEPRSPIAEAFRSIRTNIDFTAIDSSIHSLVVVSATPSEGKSTVAMNLAIVLAQSERRVILVDGDLRKPSLHKKFLHLFGYSGLGDLFLESRTQQLNIELVASFLQITEVPNLRILTAGKQVPNPAEIMGSDKMASILHHLTQMADIVVIDTPPILAVTDAVVLAPRVDGVILVIKSGITKLDACRQTVDQLRRVGARLLGSVLNDVRMNRSAYPYYHYSGHYIYGKQYGELQPENQGLGKKEA